MTAAFVLVSACAPPQAARVSPSPTRMGPLQAPSQSFHGGEVGLAYTPVALSATGGVAPYAWSVSSGVLPSGLSLGSDGSVRGKPSAAGTFSFTIQVADAENSTSTVAGTISVAPQLSASLIPACAQYCYVELGCVSACGTFGQQTGGAAPYSYALTKGTLPAGTSLSGLGLTGTFAGQNGLLQFTVQITDADGATVMLSPKFWMLDHLTLLGGSCTYSRQQGLPCTVSLQYLGGIGNVALKVDGWVGGSCGGSIAPVTCAMPPIGGAGSGGYINVTIGRVSPNTYPFPSGTFTISITDQSLCSDGTYCASADVALKVVAT